MAKIEFIGNLGSDARVENINGSQFVAFNVADTSKWTDRQGQVHEETQWISCTLNGDGGKLLPFLQKGKTVFIRGILSTRVFSSKIHKQMMAGLNCAVREIELVSGTMRSVPRQLNDESGKLFDIYEAYYIDPRLEQKPTKLLDRQSREYAIDQNGFVTPVSQEPAADTAAAETDNQE